MRIHLIQAYAGKCARLVALSVIMGTLSGCAFSKTPVKIVLAPGATKPLTSEPKAGLQIGEVKDERTTSDPRAVWQKANAYGTTSGAYVADRPVAELFRDALASTLKENSFRIGPTDAAYELKAHITDLKIEAIQMGMMSSKVVSKLFVRFELIDKKSGSSLWRDTLVGKSEDKPGGWAGVAFVEKNFKIVAEEVLNALVADKAFRKFFE